MAGNPEWVDAMSSLAAAIERLKQMGWRTMEGYPPDERSRWMLCADEICAVAGCRVDGQWLRHANAGRLKPFSPFLWREVG